MKKRKANYTFLFAVLFLIMLFSPGLNASMFQQDSTAVQGDSLTMAEGQDSVQSESQDATVARLKSALKSKGASAKTFWDLTTAGGNVAYVILGVFVLGTIIIVFKAWAIGRDWYHSRGLLKVRFSELGLDEIESQVEEAEDSTLKQMLKHTIGYFHAGGNTLGIQQELVTFIELKNDQFESYRSWVNFLSDSAGGLGLLGTVWGIFQTFFGGELDPDKILNGMGVALITTLFGVIVSLIINLGATQTFSSFSNRMEETSDKGDELRLYLLQRERKNGHVPYRSEKEKQATVKDDPSKHSIDTTALDKIVERFENAIRSPRENDDVKAPVNGPVNEPKISASAIQPIPGNLFTGEIRKKALKLQVEDKANRSLAHTKIKLSCQGAVYFEGKKRELEVETDKAGHVEVNLLAGEKVGDGSVAFWIAGDKDHIESIDIQVQPNIPSQLIIQKGNNQPGRVGQRLNHPLQVLARDQYGNPVPDAEVNFRILLGDGHLNGGTRNYLASTNEFGITEVDVTLSNEPGFHKVEAALKDGKGTPVEFHILGTQ
ncbi:MAG: hypothetical protein DWQ10_11275 [Calditrichaeota bacterium]|nr:MAG: hypothetical protein DWQ10_11275 [Calditrichota bacterium]